MAKNGTIAALDIGSSKVACFIANIESSGKIKIAGIGHQISQGIKAGIIIDVKQAENSILSAVHAAEKMAGETIDQVIINVSGSSLSSHIINVETTVSGHEVTDRDVNHIIRQGYEHFNQDEIEILHCIPIDYSIDDSKGIKDPRGMYGDKLSTELHIVTASSTAVRNLANCLARCHLNIEECVTSPYVSSLACLTEDEKNLGAILLDIGSGNTSIAMFAAGNPVYVDSIALGGSHVTRDIARGLSTSITYAERIKSLYGSVVSTESDEREIIDIPLSDLTSSEMEDEEVMGTENSYISRALLTSIIKPRMEEILEMARKNLENKGLYKVSGPRVILTGGASQLQGLKELAGHIFNKHARIGKPMLIEGLAESTKGPAFSTCVGMLQYAMEKRKMASGSIKETENLAKKGAINKMIKWFQENF